MLSDDWRTAKDSTGGNLYWQPLRRKGLSGAVRREDRPNLFYPIYLRTDGTGVQEVGDPIPLAEEPSYDAPSGTVCIWPIRAQGGYGYWQISAENCRRLVKSGFLRVNSLNTEGVRYLKAGEQKKIQDGTFVVTGHRPDGSVTSDGGETSFVPGTQWRVAAHDAGIYGTNLVSALLPGRRFPFPKSIYAVEDVLRFFVKDKPTATILDFFAGSGTTAHAVMRLNKQDGGERQCISVTNNEVSVDEQRGLRKQDLRPGDPDWEALGICDYITKPRITAAISGNTPQGDPIKGAYKFTDEFPMSDGFEENAVFFTQTYEDPLSVRHHRAFERIATMLWLRAGSQGRIINDLGEDGWDVAEAYGVLENIDLMGDFVARVAEVETVETVFVVTDSDAAYQMTCRDLPKRVTAVRLYESYLHNFQINRRAGA